MLHSAGVTAIVKTAKIPAMLSQDPCKANLPLHSTVPNWTNADRRQMMVSTCLSGAMQKPV
jgi:hypothetical protein